MSETSKFARYRARKKAKGLREIRLWLPDVNAPGFWEQSVVALQGCTVTVLSGKAEAGPTSRCRSCIQLYLPLQLRITLPIPIFGRERSLLPSTKDNAMRIFETAAAGLIALAAQILVVGTVMI